MVYTYILNIKYLVWFGLVLWHIKPCRLFNDKSFLYIYFKYFISKHILPITFLYESVLIFFTQLNCFLYFYLIRIILFTINHLFAHRCFQILLCITNNSIKHQSFVYTQLKDQTILFLAIHLFVLSLNVKQFYLIYK